MDQQPETGQQPAEPADGVLLYWPGRDADDVPVVVVRDDTLAGLQGYTEARWYSANDPAGPSTWGDVCEWASEHGYPLVKAITLSAVTGGSCDG